MARRGTSARGRVAGEHLRTRGVKQAPFRILMGAAMPAVLVELGFLSNADEEARLNDASYRQELIDALVDAVLQFRGASSRLGREKPLEPGPGRGLEPPARSLRSSGLCGADRARRMAAGALFGSDLAGCTGRAGSDRGAGHGRLGGGPLLPRTGRHALPRAALDRSAGERPGAGSGRWCRHCSPGPRPKVCWRPSPRAPGWLGSTPALPVSSTST